MWFIYKSDYPDILEYKFESYSVEDPQSGGSTDIINYLMIYLKLIFHLLKILLLHLLLSVSIVERTWVMTLLEIIII